MAKIITPQHITGEKGVAEFNSYCVNHNPYFIFREETKNDFGIDGEVELTKINEDKKLEATGEILKIQLKSTATGGSYISQNTDNSFEFNATANDIEYWQKHPIPVILVVYFEKENKLYAQKVEKQLVLPKSKNFKILFDKEKHILSEGESGFNEIIGQEFVQRIEFGIQEKLQSNIINLQLPRLIHKFKTKHNKNSDVYNILNEEGISFPKFTIKSNILYSFSDLKNISSAITSKIVEGTKSIESIPITKFTGDINNRNIIVEITNSYLKDFFYRKNISFNKEHSRFFFRMRSEKPLKTKKKSEIKSTETFEIISYKSNNRNATRSVVTKYTYHDTFFYKHLGFQLKYEWFDNSLKLIIEPKYHYTQDGKELLDNPKRITRLNNQIKITERNNHYLNHIKFFLSYFGGTNWNVSDGFTDIQLKKFFYVVDFGIRENKIKRVTTENNQQTSLDL